MRRVQYIVVKFPVLAPQKASDSQRNVCVVENFTKRSSNTLLRLVRLSMTQTLYQL